MSMFGYTSRSIPRSYTRLFAAVGILFLIRWFWYYNPEEARQGLELKYNVPKPAFQRYAESHQPLKVDGKEKPLASSPEAYGSKPDTPKPDTPKPDPSQPEGSKEFIVASLKGDDVSWFAKYFPDWKANIFVMNDASAPLTVAKNKGREATAYLTYMIDNYDNLPDYMVFLHALRYQWHNEDPMYDGVPMLRALRLQRIADEGYINMRCTWTIGCPAEIQPPTDPDAIAAADETERSQSEAAYAAAFQELFPNMTVPAKVGIQCGAQFALSRAKVRERPREDYERYRQWLWDTPLADSVSGRVLEYSWHMMMGKEAVHCPDAGDCFCKTYGLCDLDCPDPSYCRKRYQLPQFATIPDGWPEEGPGSDGWPAKDWWRE